MADQPVTGSCQQCDRKYALLVPEPGSGDLALHGVSELFGWCAGCGRLVGRACCWGSDGRCASCAAQATSGDTVGGFAALGAARAAVRQLDGMAAQFSAVEDTIAAAAAARPLASEAWGRSWLAAGSLRARIDGSREAAASLLRLIPADDAERAEELHDELLTVVGFLDARWRGTTEAMREAGRRLARRSPKPRRVLSAVGARPQPREVVAVGPPPPPPAAAVAVAVPIPIRAPDRAVIPVRAPVPAAAARPATFATAATHSPVLPPAAPAAPAAPGVPAAPAALAAPARLPSRAHWVGQPSAHVEPRVVAPAPAEMPAITPAVTPAVSSARERLPGRAGILLVAVVALALPAAIIAVGRQPDAAADGSADPAGIADPAATASAADSAQSPSASPLSVGTQDLPSSVMTVDAHPIGPVDLQELQVTRVIGAPEVAAFPSAFDRSLRLGGPAAGLCLPSAAGGSALSLDLHLGELGTGAGRLVVSFAGRAGGLTLDLASLATLDRNAWYRLTMAAVDGAGLATVSTLADDRPTLELELQTSAGDVPATAGEVCLHAELPATDSSAFVDNLRVDG